MAMANSRSKAVFFVLCFAICRLRSSNPSQPHVMQSEVGQARSGGRHPGGAAGQMPQFAPPSTGAFSGGPAVSALPASQLPTTSSGAPATRTIGIPPMPKFPQVVLYDQYDNAGFNATFSGTFTDFTGFDADLADDFVVPAGQTWNVESIDADGVYFNGGGPANSFNVFISPDN